MALLDVFLLSSGFVLRVLLGCVLVQVEPSNWLLLCTSTLALFLGLAKRRGDVVAGVDDTHRPSLAGYNLSFLDQAIGVTSGMAIVAEPNTDQASRPIISVLGPPNLSAQCPAGICPTRYPVRRALWMAPMSAIDSESSRDMGTASSVKLLRATAAIMAALHASWKTLLRRTTCDCSVCSAGKPASPLMGTATHCTCA